jgi:hypothetical protein
VSKLQRILSGWLNRFSSDVRGVRSANPTGRQIESLEKRVMLTGTITGDVFSDINDDAQFGPGEPGIPGVTVYIDVNDTQNFVSTDPHATTDAGGNFSFADLADGAYILRVIPPTGGAQTFPLSGVGQHVTVAGDTVSQVNFGIYTPATTFSILGTVYHDLNNNGTMDPGEPGDAGVTVYIDTNDSHIFQPTDPQTTTDVNGNYAFSNLAAGDYVVREIVPTGLVQSEPAGQDGQHVQLSPLSQEYVDFGNFTPNGAVTEADMDVIQGYAYDPTNLSNHVEVEIVISGGPTQEILANQTNTALQAIIGSTTHEFTYSTPVLSVGAHTVQIFVINTVTDVTSLLATETVTSQNSLFDEHYYLTTYPNVAAAVKAGQFATGYDHYIEYGQYEGYNPSPYWDEAYYLQENPDVAAAVKAGTATSGFMNYYLYGQYEGRGGLLYFNTQYYLETNPDVAAAVTAGTISSAFEHFVLYGQYEGRSPMLYFNSAIYDEDNADILPFVTGETFSSDYEQFIEYGQYEGRVASLLYNETAYLRDNPDVAAAVRAGEFPDGFQHWLEYGQFEGRKA